VLCPFVLNSMSKPETVVLNTSRDKESDVLVGVLGQYRSMTHLELRDNVIEDVGKGRYTFKFLQKKSREKLIECRCPTLPGESVFKH
jgi:hypothetical protein